MAGRRPQTLQQTLPGLGRILRRLWPYVRQHPSVLATAVGALVAAVGLKLLEPWSLKFIFDRLIPAGRSRPAQGWTTWTPRRWSRSRRWRW